MAECQAWLRRLAEMDGAFREESFVAAVDRLREESRPDFNNICDFLGRSEAIPTQGGSIDTGAAYECLFNLVKSYLPESSD